MLFYESLSFVWSQEVHIREIMELKQSTDTSIEINLSTARIVII